MRLKKRFVVPVMAMIAVLALGTGLLATGALSSIVSSSPAKATYTEVPAEAQLEKDLGFTPVVPEAFANGYAFTDGVIGTEKGQDDQGNTLDKHKFLSCDYVKDGDEVTYYASKWTAELKDGDTVTEVYNGVDLYYNSYLSKTVPEDYEFTAQDKADEAAGKYVFSVSGGDEVTVEEVQSISWHVNDLHYNLLAVDSSLTQADMIAMAKEIIR